jgi:hypothetical protein
MGIARDLHALFSDTAWNNLILSILVEYINLGIVI